MSAEELIHACAESNNGAAWKEFVARFHRPISLSILRAANQWGSIPREVVDDLVQETYLKLWADKCRLLLSFTIEHPDAVVGYIRTIAINVARDHFKSLHSQKSGAGNTDQFLEDAEPPAQSSGLGGTDAMEREVLLKQIDRCLKNCSSTTDPQRDRTIFWLCCQQGMTAEEIANVPGIGLGAKGVESALSRLKRCIRKQLVAFRSPDAV